MHSSSRRDILAATAIAAFLPKAFAAIERGDLLPQQIGIDLDGDAVSLAPNAGKAIIVSFWASWCPYCLKELPILNNIQRAAGKENMHVVAVNTEAREVYRKVARALRVLDIQIAHDMDHKSRTAYGVNAIPHMVIAGRDGRALSIYRGYDESQLDDIVVNINKALATRS